MDLNPGESRVVQVDGREVAVFNVEGRFYAVSNRCPHRGGPLVRGHLEGTAVRCPLHGWLFDLKTGQCLNQPGVSVKTFRVENMVEYGKNNDVPNWRNLPLRLSLEGQQIVDKIAKGYAPQKIYLFGSYAWGEPNEDSDLDLLVIKETHARRIDREVEVVQLFDGPSRRLPVDVFVLTPEELERRRRRGDPFVEMILTEGRLLYAA